MKALDVNVDDVDKFSGVCSSLPPCGNFWGVQALETPFLVTTRLTMKQF